MFVVSSLMGGTKLKILIQVLKSILGYKKSFSKQFWVFEKIFIKIALILKFLVNISFL